MIRKGRQAAENEVISGRVVHRTTMKLVTENEAETITDKPEMVH
jgi:hypothetical protein